MKKTLSATLALALLTVGTVSGVANAASAEMRISGPCNAMDHYRPPCYSTSSGGTGKGSSRASASGGTGDSSNTTPPIWCPGPQPPKIADDGTKYCPPV
jgi:hypothetical protein